MTLVPPPGLLAAALLFWGWRTGLWPLVPPMALVLELAPRVGWRWALEDRELARVIDLSTLLWVGALILLFIRYLNQPPLATHLYTLASWFPLLLFLPLAIQRYSAVGAFRVGHLFYSLRHSGSALAWQPLRLDTPYFVATLLAASVAASPDFLPGAGLLLLWALLATRPRRHRWLLTATLALAAGLAAFPLSLGLYRLQISLEDQFVEWFEDWFMEVDPYRSYTALGEIGELKQSGRVVLRLKPAPDDPGPWLLRDASYNSYFDGAWQAKGTRFDRLASRGDGREWTLGAAPAGVSRHLAITLELRRGAGMLPLPAGAWRLERLPVGELQLSNLGALKASDGPGLVDYRVTSTPAATRDAPPGELDLALPRREQATLERLATELGLIGSSPPIVAAKVKAFLLGQFRYSLELPAPAAGMTALETFLLQARAGHCEYFASAAVLLLRAAGVPARYATGFAVAEYSPLEDAYVARRRHAHAWALVWLDGRWRDFDATPPDWTGFEEARTPWWQRVGDLWAWLSHRFNRWRWRETTATESDNGWLWGLAGLLTLVLLWRLLLRRRVRPVPAGSVLAVTVEPGAESPFYQVIADLSAQAGARPSGETLEAWLRRIGAWNAPGLADMARWHQRWRFDPVGLVKEERQRLAKTVAAWRQQNSANGQR
ncbi:MAG: transglutaminase-like domain-containing protein [Candidatus Contendobacter sp.]|nr:transglutaminase-like domain-containing protein [Candidatus Contendobacter sp.]MDS4058059.1 transglutaminase-like domain-containing protein [Candidatus Contendobacter sp.]